jgi:hypothetical protein
MEISREGAGLDGASAPDNGPAFHYVYSDQGSTRPASPVILRKRPVLLQDTSPTLRDMNA